MNLMRTPSILRIAAENFHTKPLNTTQTVRYINKLTTTTPASSEETKIAIDALLSLGSDLPPEDDITKENATLMPIGNIAVPQSANSSEVNGDNNANLQVGPDQSTPHTCTCTCSYSTEEVDNNHVWTSE